jgi:hypothetical protein
MPYAAVWSARGRVLLPDLLACGVVRPPRASCRRQPGFDCGISRRTEVEDLTSTVSVEPIVHEVIAPHFGAAIVGPTDRRPASAKPFVNLPEWISPEMRSS